MGIAMGGISISGMIRRGTSLLGCLVLVAVGLLVLPSTAYAAASFSSMYPGAGATLAESPSYVSVYVDDATDILSTTTLKLDGVTQSTYVDWPGHYEDPDCMEGWVVDDYTAATVSAYFGSTWLTEGLHTVEVTVYTSGSGTSTYTWSFTLDFPSGSVSFSNQFPANGATIIGNTNLRVNIVSPVAVQSGNCAFFLNGRQINANWGASGTSIQLTTGVQVPVDGLNTVVVRVRDNAGTVTENSWSFTAQITPTISSFSPWSGSTVTVPRPPISFTVTDNTPGQVTVRLTLDGTVVFDGLVNQGAFSWTPPAELASGVSHPVQARVTDAAGLQVSNSWSFTVQAPAAMSDRTNCGTCHAVSAHPMGNCSGCHVSAGGDDHSGAPVAPCYDCHGYWAHDYSLIQYWSCTSCHSGAYPQITTGHTAAALETSHLSATLGCEECHDRALVTEHSKYPSGSAFKYQCATCHASANPAVTGAIATADTRCTTCHPTGTDHLSLHVSPTTSACFGAGCHDASKNLVTVHDLYAGEGSPNSAYPTSCKLCHNNPAINTDTSGKSCTPACHSGTTHSGYMAGHAITAASATCTTAACHGNDLAGLHGAWAGDYSRCAVCHSKKDNWTKTADCASCHPGLDHGPLHDSPLEASCQECHELNISLEHGEACSTCHDSSDPAVVSAIAAADVSCSACHPAADHETVHTPSPTISTYCAECHSANVMTEHVTNRGLTCDVCHGVENPTSVALTPLAAGPLKLGGVQVAGISALGGLAAAGEVSAASEGMTDDDIWTAIETGDTSCLACHPDIHLSLGSVAMNPSAPGYVSWTWATANASESGTPHGNYATTTNKCSVCHSVHRATKDGVALTAVPEAGYSTYADSCSFCHGTGSTFSDATIAVAADGSLTPHGQCEYCHVLSPHGLGGSAYPVLASRLLNAGADVAITSDLTAGANGLNGTMFDLTNPALEPTGLTLGTGYLCAVCHGDAGQMTFAVNASGAAPRFGAAPSNVTGHRVTATVTTNWNQAGEYGAMYSGGGAAGATSQVAYNPANSCQSCHDARRTSGEYAFPHGYVDTTGAYADSSSPGASLVWLTTANHASEAKIILGVDLSSDSDQLTRDGLCLKCHRGSASSGVGFDF